MVPKAGPRMNGAGQEWVLLRGLTREARHWGDFHAAFQNALPAARVIAIDLPGCGLFNQQKSPRRIKDIAIHVRREWQKHQDQSLSGKFILGMSFGGMVAIELANQFHVDGLVLVNSSLASLSSPFRRLRLAIWPDILRMFSERDLIRRESSVYRLTSNKAESAERHVKDWVRIQQQNPVGRDVALAQIFAAATYRPSRRPSCPVLVLASKADRFVDYRCSNELTTWLHATYGLHPAAGHDLTLDDPDWVTKEVLSWLTRCPPVADKS